MAHRDQRLGAIPPASHSPFDAPGSAQDAPASDGTALSAFPRLLFYNWKLSILCLLAGMAVSFLLFGLWWPYWWIADMDTFLAYQGLLFNDGLPQEFFDHPAYLSYLSLGAWYWLLHGLGLLPVDALSSLPPATDATAFNHAWQQLIAWGRVLSLLIAAIYVTTFAILVRRLFADWRLAILAATALAYSGGIAMHFRVIRTELLSSALATTALLLALIVAREPKLRHRALFLVASGLCAALAVVDKVQAIFVVLLIPLIALFFGTPADESDARADVRRGEWASTLMLLILAVATTLPALALIWIGIESGRAVYHPIGGGLAGTYQWLIAGFVVLAMIVYAKIWRTSFVETIAALAAIALGVNIGILSLLLSYNLQNIMATANPIEHMFTFAAWSLPALSNEPQIISGTLIATLFKGLGRALAAHTFVLHTSPRPTLLLEWFAIAGGIVAWRHGERRLPLQIAVLVISVWGLDTLFTLRGLKLEYFAYSDPLLILAAALVATRIRADQVSLRAQRVTLGLLALTIIWAHAEPVKTTLSHRTAQETCSFYPHYVSRVTFPFCLPPS